MHLAVPKHDALVIILNIYDQCFHSTLEIESLRVFHNFPCRVVVLCSPCQC